MSRVLLDRAWGLSTGPTACALVGRRCAQGGRRKGVPGGGAFCRCEGRLGSGAPPPPTARPPGGLSGSATHVLWARVCACGGPALAPWLVCPVGGCAPWGWWGASGFRRAPFPAARPLGALPGPAGHVLWARMWVCAVCVVTVWCVPWCVVLPFVCPSGAPLSGALLWFCARRVLAVPPSLRAVPRSLNSMATFFLMEPNSLIVPAQNSLKGHQGGRPVREARYQEMEVLVELDMHDVWGLAHSGSEHPTPAETYGWAHKGHRAKPRRLDRIQVNAALRELVSGAYTVLTGADHNAVVLQISPPAEIQGKPRPRFQEGVLGDEQAMLELQEQVASVSIDDPEDWWAEALSVVSAAGR